MPLVKTPKFNVGEYVKVKYFNKVYFFEGTIVHIFKKLELPSQEKIIKYYGTLSKSPKFGNLFGPMYEDRIVIEKASAKKDYAILQMAGYGRYFDIIKRSPMIITNIEEENNLLLAACIKANQYLAYLVSEGKLNSQNEINNWMDVQQTLANAIKIANGD